MPPAREQIQARAHVLGVVRLGHDAAAKGNDGIGGEDVSAGFGDATRLLGRHALGIDPGQLVAVRRLVYVGRGHAVRNDADLGQQGEAPGTGRGEDQGGQRLRAPAFRLDRLYLKRPYLKRNVIRPLDRS